MRFIGFLIFVLVCGLGILWLPHPEPVQEPVVVRPIYPVEPVQSHVRDVTPQGALPGPKITGKQIARLPDLVKKPAKVPSSPIRRFHKPIVRSAGIIAANNSILHLYGIEPLALEAICKTENNENWPCGRFARTAMRGLIRGRAINCDLSGTAANTSLPIVVKCNVGRRDIAGWLVRQGWAKDIGGNFAEQMVLAKKAKIGMWRNQLP